MNPQQFRTLVANIRASYANLSIAVNNLDILISRVERQIDPNEPLNSSLTQDEVNRIIGVYSAPYTAVLTAIETATDSLGTDALH